MNKPNVQALVEKLSATHPLQAAGGNYKRDFISAVENVYPVRRIEKTLQEKFFVPDDSQLNLGRYLQSAVELSVQNDLKRNPLAESFEIDKKVNPPKNVEAYYKACGTAVSLEVKCGDEKSPHPESLVLKSAGRVPGFKEKAGVLHEIFRNSQSGHVLETIKNTDNAMKDFLISAHSKFSPDSSIGDLNVLLVACGNIANINDWWQNLYGSRELFTAESYYPTPDDFRLVDVVILSNLKYLHTEAREHHDWTLKNAFLVPFLNPRGRSSLTGSSLKSGLSVFDHHYYRFNNFIPKRNDPFCLHVLKIGCYYLEALDENEKIRYFPVQPPAKPSQPLSKLTEL